MIVPVVVEGQSLRWYGRIPEIADNSIEFVQLEFRFPEDWDGMIIVAQFTQTKTYNCLLVNNRCFLPRELVAGPCEVSVFGYLNEEVTRGTTIPLKFNIIRSGFVSSAETPIPPTPDLYAQLVEYFSSIAGSGGGGSGSSTINPEDIAAAVEAYLSKNPPESGADGGYYTPAVTQPTDDTMEVAFTPSKAGMPAVQPATVKLPVGSGSNSSENVNTELFDKADLPLDTQSFVTLDGVEYYRYHAGATYGFTWNNPHPQKGAVTITARGVSQYGGTGGTRLKTVYDDGTSGPDLYIVVGGESRTVTVTTDENKTLSKITGNYDLEDWVLLDMSVMSVKAEYLVQEEYVLPVATADVLGGIKADPKTEADTQPVRIGEDGKLYTAPGTSSGGNAEPTAIAQHRRLRTFTVPADVSADTSGITWITDDTGAVTGFEFDTDADGNAFTCTELLLFAQGRCAEAGRVDFYTGNTELCSMPSMQMAGDRTTTAKIYKFGRVWVIEGSVATAHRFQHDTQGVSRSGWVGRYEDTTVTEITSFKAQGQKAFSSGYMFDIWGR